MAAVLVIAYLSQGIPAFYRRVMDSAPVTTALPLGAAAWWLCLAGAAAALVAARAFPAAGTRLGEVAGGRCSDRSRGRIGGDGGCGARR
ncbi:hypothetical protein ATO49_08105 [Mycolicibacterium fortuitum subsp. fortuitum DSM 46621 = ATCC 6841 = JCM 6387]|nr:hypothetical protein ATO49_08105 [Mycolicibacterium fortuitum subsp. fortuitum DSM 46621 = ATCC 6841 = JCM 6387]